MQIPGCYLGYVRKSRLNDKFSSIPNALSETRFIRYMEHPNTNSFITQFVSQRFVDFLEAYALEYVVRKTNIGMYWRP